MTGAGIDRRWVGVSFGRAAADYDAFAALQRRAGDALLERISSRLGADSACLDLGAGTGHALPTLRHPGGASALIALDLSPAMLSRARTREPTALCVAGDAENLPFAPACMDLVYSNLALQWCNNLPRAFTEAARVLRPGGWLAFSLFGPATLSELRAAWAQVDDHSHISAFPTAAETLAALRAAGLTLETWHETLERVTYPDVPAVLAGLRGLGARNLTRDRPRHLMTRTHLERLYAAYPRQNSTSVVASFEIFSSVLRHRARHAPATPREESP